MTGNLNIPGGIYINPFCTCVADNLVATKPILKLEKQSTSANLSKFRCSFVNVNSLMCSKILYKKRVKDFSRLLIMWEQRMRPALVSVSHLVTVMRD